jgi:hypothetical protein
MYADGESYAKTYSRVKLSRRNNFLGEYGDPIIKVNVPYV